MARSVVVVVEVAAFGVGGKSFSLPAVFFQNANYVGSIDQRAGKRTYRRLPGGGMCCRLPSAIDGRSESGAVVASLSLWSIIFARIK